MEGKEASSGRSAPFAAVLYSEPGTLGLVCNIIAAFVVAVGNILYGLESVSELSTVVGGLHLILIGGFIQLTAGIMSFRRNDHLTGTAFTVFATLWTFQGGANIIMKESTGDITRSVLPVLIAYITIALSLFICSLFVNFIIPPVLIAMTLTLTFESVGLFYEWGKRVAVVFEVIIVLTAIYAVVVMGTKGISQRYILPGFGNAPIDPLLIKRNVKKSHKKEKRKNTQYAEPMGMGYMGNVIPASVICFLGLGYFQNMTIPILAVVCSSLLSILASYYSFLRGDFFNSIQFTVHFIFWTSKSSFFYILPVDQISSTDSYYGSWGTVLALVFITVCSSTQPIIVLVYNGLLTLTAVLSVEHIPLSVQSYTFGVSALLSWVMTLYISTAHLLNSCAEKPVLFVGSELVSEERLFCCCKRAKKRDENGTLLDDDDEKRDQIINAIFFLCNMVTAIALSPLEIINQKASLSLLLTTGVFGNLLVARYSYAWGSLSRAFICATGCVVWSAWSLYILNASTGLAMDSVTAITSVGLCTLSIVLTISMPRTWTVLVMSLLVHSISAITKVYDANAKYYPLISSILVGLVGTYGFILYLGKGFSDESLLPEGKPLLKMRKPERPNLPCPTFRSRIASDMLKAADILERGEVICVPTDTVYALAGSCSQPESISKIYHIKGRPPEKPICLCISNLQQLRIANPPFSPLLWRFMDRCYPGGITFVVKKGDWLQNMGVGTAAEYVGTKESVAIRVPDSSVLSYLVSLTGPLAITSANPSGKPDSTHHDTVIDTLGRKLAGVVCDDESNETVASTVVNCMKIDEGVISYFRVGCVPQEIVDNLFEKVKKEMPE